MHLFVKWCTFHKINNVHITSVSYFLRIKLDISSERYKISQTQRTLFSHCLACETSCYIFGSICSMAERFPEKSIEK